MITAIILLKTDRDAINNVAQELAELRGVTEVYSVAGRYDLVAIIRVKQNEQLADLVTGKMRAISGISDTETMVAFQAHSAHDLETMFAVGLE